MFNISHRLKRIFRINSSHYYFPKPLTHQRNILKNLKKKISADAKKIRDATDEFDNRYEKRSRWLIGIFLTIILAIGCFFYFTILPN